MNPLAPTVEQICMRSTKAAQSVYSPPDRTLCRVLGMLKMYFPAGDESMTPHVALDGCWEAHVTSSVWRIVEPGMTVLNAGAHVGYYALLAARIVGPKGRVDAFEPLEELRCMLKANASLNGVESIVHVGYDALWDVCESEPALYWRRGRQSEASMCSTYQMTNSWRREAVYTARLDDFDDGAIPRPDVMILDAEGAEPHIIRGAESKIRESPFGPWIVCDWNPVAFKSCREGAEALLSLGYLISRINADGTWTMLQPDEFRNLAEPTMIVCKRHPGGAE